MKLSDYIESGILEEFCMGVLDEKSERKVLLLAQKYPAIQNEIDRIQETLFQLDQKNAVSPSVNVKNKLLAQIGVKEEEEEQYPEVNSESKINSQPLQRRLRLFQYTTAAAVTALIISISSSIYLNTQLKEIEAENISLKGDLIRSQEQFANLEDEHIKYTSILQNKEYKQIPLNGIGNHTESFANIFRGEDQILISMAKLPKPPKNMQYQFWAIVDGAPVSVGLIDRKLDTNQLFKIQNQKNASAFAISLEPIGGKDSPTAEQIHVLGNVI